MVPGLSGHETEVQTTVAALRAQAIATPAGLAQPDFSGLAVLMRAVAEVYPSLKAQESFLALQAPLTETEQRIALAGSYDNVITTQFATWLEIIFDRWVGALGEMQPEPRLSASDFERVPVKVEPTS